MTTDERVNKIEREYDLPEMEYRDMGIIHSWFYLNKNLNFKISVDSNKNLRLQRVSK